MVRSLDFPLRVRELLFSPEARSGERESPSVHGDMLSPIVSRAVVDKRLLRYFRLEHGTA